MKKFIYALTLLAVILTVSVLSLSVFSADADTVWLSASGSDSGSGTQQSPYATLSKALSAVPDGGNIRISGTITLPSSFTWSAHNKTVTITGGTLNGQSLSGGRLIIGDNVTLEDMTLTFDSEDAVYANGNTLTIGEGVTTTNAIKVYGGGISGTTVDRTDITLLSGTYTRIYGGGNGGSVRGDTKVYVGGTVNAGLDVTSHSGTNNVYGGGYNSAIGGSTYLTFADSARAIYVFGGGDGASSSIGETAHTTFSGGASMSFYGGNNNSSGIKAVHAVVSGGEIEQVFGANQAASMTGDVDLRVIGGKITRRIYGGCYNEADAGLFSATWLTSHHVTGNITLTVGAGASITLNDNDNDRGIFANSRYKSDFDDEVTAVVFADSAAMSAYKSKLGQKDTLAAMGGINTPACDTRHCYTYTASGNTVTQTCSEHSSLSATATLIVTGGSFTYTGNEITPAYVSYSGGWEYDPLSDITYANNINAGTATASCSVSGITVSVSFTIGKAEQSAPIPGKRNETVLGKADGAITSLTYDMEYSTDGVSYTPVTDRDMLLGAGTYYVRYAENDNYHASPAATVTIEQGRTLKITFKAEGSQDIVKEVAWSQTLTDIPAIPERTGHTATAPYWSEADFTGITSDMTVTAVYTPDKMTVTFTVGGQVFATKTVDYGKALTDIPAVPAKDGHSAAWDVTDFSNITGNITVTAVYTAAPVTVTFTVDGSVFAIKTVSHGTALTDIPSVPAKDGHSAAWDVTDFSNITENITVTAVYTPNKMTVTFVADGNVYETRTVDYGKALADIPAVPAKDGHTAEWNVTDFSNITGNITVTAIYTPLPPAESDTEADTGSDTTQDTDTETDTDTDTVPSETAEDTDSSTESESESETDTEPASPSEDTVGQTVNNDPTDTATDSASAPAGSGCGGTVIGGTGIALTALLGFGVAAKKKED